MKNGHKKNSFYLGYREKARWWKPTEHFALQHNGPLMFVPKKHNAHEELVFLHAKLVTILYFICREHLEDR